ncbi:hypothetical protein [Pseudonocardia sp. GCM10023141]|uniref:hypothetical protein n=1 Tax=Pseudonocardia sp. GCM10023141 TaxID=3252653 RepID=UPI00360B603B
MPDALDVLAEHDDGVLSRVVDGPGLRAVEIWTAVAVRAGAGRLHPVVFGSALTGQGVTDLTAALALLRGVAERARHGVERPAPGGGTSVPGGDRVAPGAPDRSPAPYR